MQPMQSGMTLSKSKPTATPVSYTHLRAHETSLRIAYAVFCLKKIFLMIRRPPRSTLLVNRRQRQMCIRDSLDIGDIEEAMNAAHAVGDDTLQEQAYGYSVPDSFTHGTSEQRMRWFKRGYQYGDLQHGDTFSLSDSEL